MEERRNESPRDADGYEHGEKDEEEHQSPGGNAGAPRGWVRIAGSARRFFSIGCSFCRIGHELFSVYGAGPGVKPDVAEQAYKIRGESQWYSNTI